MVKLAGETSYAGIEGSKFGMVANEIILFYFTGLGCQISMHLSNHNHRLK